jgi:protein TonB
LQFTADGSVTSAAVSQSSHNRDLDRAALSWAKQVKLCPGAAGTGFLPIVMKL